MKSISVIIPVFNTSQFLPKCLDSVLNQNYKNFEILLINDGSSDDSSKICDKYERGHECIHYIDLEKNRGVSFARNVGLDNAKGDFIAFVDSDDWIEPNMFSLLVEAIEKNQSSISACNFTSHNLDSGKIGEIGYAYSPSNRIMENKEDLIYHYLKYNDAYLWNKIYENNVFEDLRFPEGHEYEDWYVMHRIYEKAESMCIVDNKLYNYAIRSGSILHKKMNMDRLYSLIERYNYISINYPYSYEKLCRAQIFKTILFLAEQLELEVDKEPFDRNIIVNYEMTVRNIFDKLSFQDCDLKDNEVRSIELLKKGFGYFNFVRKLKNR